MAAPSLSQTRLYGNICKPSADLPGKHGRIPAPPKPCRWIGAKRKRDEDVGVANSDATSSLPPPDKKQKIFFARANSAVLPLSRSDLQHGSKTLCKAGTACKVPRCSLILRNLSQPTRTLITLHKFFLKAISIHYAHNGPHAAAELGRLLQTVTRLWKERSVTQADVQKVLAIYEINANVGGGVSREISQSSSPFKLVVAGSCITAEYVGKRKDMMGPLSAPFDEKDLHDSYRSQVYGLELAWAREQHHHLSFFGEDSLENFAKLRCDVGTQTATRNMCISQQRAEILSLSRAAQHREETISSTINPSDGPAVLENRKQNLLDRIQAKQLTSKANAKPAPSCILRQHALGRIKEVVEILRMMQHQQKRGAKSKASDETSIEFRSGSGAARVSFSLAQLQSNIKSSARVPISNKEVTMCLKMLSEELDGTWVTTVQSRGTSNAAFVVVEGEGMSGQEAHSKLLR